MCGSRRHEESAPDCPAKDGTCFRCEKKGHFANRCPDKRRRPAPDSGTLPLETKAKTGSANSTKRDEVKLVKPAPSFGSSDDSDDYAFNINETQGHLPAELEENRVSLDVGGIRMKMYIDSGSSKALFDSQTWARLKRKKIQFQNAVVSGHIFPYGKTRPLDITKAVYIKFSSRSASTWAKAYILAESEGRCEAILGSRAAKRLNILRVGEETPVSSRRAESDAVRQLVASDRPKEKSVTGKLKKFQLQIPQDPSVAPVAQGCRRIPFALRKPLRERTDALLGEDIIERVYGATPWVSNVVPVLKKNGDLRVCVDMRRANQAVLREHFPIPTFDEIVADLRDCEYFSKIDLVSAYHQIELAPESRGITTFVTPDGLFRFKRLFFGVKCAPEIFQRIMQNLLRDIPHVRVFFDDIIIFSKTLSAHKLHVQQVRQRLEENGLTINVEKSVFGVKQIDFLGHRISKNVVEPNGANIDAVNNFGEPSSKKDLQSFLGLVNFVSRFIPHFSTITAPLRALLKKNAIFRWLPIHQKAFDTLKKMVANMKASIFNPSARTMLLTDASPVGLGAVLMQQTAPGKPPEIIAFASHSLTTAEQNYSQIEKEALGLVWGCEKFKMYLLGRRFDLLTDHKPLEMLFSPRSKPNARLERWIMRLQCFDYSVHHVSGNANIADPFSRLLQPSPGSKPACKGVKHSVFRMTELAVPKKFDIATIREKSKADAEISSIIRNLASNGSLPPLFVRLKYELTSCDGILLRGDRIVPPLSLRHAILQQAHEGHPGAEIMKRRLRTKVWWPRMDQETDAFVKKCLSCVLVSRPDPPPPLHRTSLPAQAWEYLALDHLGPLPNGDFILVVVDYFSRFVEVAFTRSTSAAETIRLLWHIFARHGFPARLKTDNAQAFRSQDFEAFLVEYGVSHVTSPPLWPQANGEVERQNRSLLKRLKIAADEGKNLEIETCKYVLLYNSTPHSTTGSPPAQLLFQRQLRDKLPSITLPSCQRDEILDRDEDKKFKGKQLKDSKSQARSSSLQPGDLVLLKNKPVNKLSTTFEREPFTVVSADDKEVNIQRGAQSLRRSIADVKEYPISQPPLSPTITESTHIPTYAEIAARDCGTCSPRTTRSLTPVTAANAVDHSPVGSPSPWSSPAVDRSSGFKGFPSPTDVSPVPLTPALPVSRSGRTLRKPARLDL